MPVPDDRCFFDERIVDASVCNNRGRYWSAVPLVMFMDERRRRDADRPREPDLIRSRPLKKIRIWPPAQLFDGIRIAISEYQNRRC